MSIQNYLFRFYPELKAKVSKDDLAHVRSFADISHVITLEEQMKTTANARQATEQITKAMKQPAPEAAPVQHGRNSVKNNPKPQLPHN